MTEKLKLIPLLLLMLLVSGCMKYAYSVKHVAPELAATGSGSLAVASHDQRDYVVSGKYRPQNVGVVRGAFGNPIFMNTASGQPLADEMGEALVAAFKQKGFEASLVTAAATESTGQIHKKLRDSGAYRLIYFQINQWRTDTWNNLRMEYDFLLTVMDERANILAQKGVSGDDNLGFLFGFNPLGMTQKRVAKALTERLEELCNDPEIVTALTGKR